METALRADIPLWTLHNSKNADVDYCIYDEESRRWTWFCHLAINHLYKAEIAVLSATLRWQADFW